LGPRANKKFSFLKFRSEPDEETSMSQEFTKIRLSKETNARIARLLEGSPGTAYSIATFSEGAIMAVLDLIEARAGERREPAIVRVFDAFREAGPALTGPPTPPVSSPRPYSAADAMAVASAVAGRSAPREVPGSGASPKTGERSSDVLESPRGTGRVSSPGKSPPVPAKAR